MVMKFLKVRKKFDFDKEPTGVHYNCMNAKNENN